MLNADEQKLCFTSDRIQFLVNAKTSVLPSQMGSNAYNFLQKSDQLVANITM